MAENTLITIQLTLPRPEATALARLLTRLEPEIMPRFAAPCRTYGNLHEADVMWAAVLTLQSALAGAGFGGR
jgi:hypothetical protein